MNQDRPSAIRLTAMESALSHHQRDYEQLHEVVIAQTAQIDQLQQRLEHCEAVLRTIMQQLPAHERDSHEPPPHY